MKKQLSFAILLAFLIGFSPFLSVSAQTYTVSGSPTSKPNYQSLSNGWVGYTQDSNVWIILSASVSGSTIKFTATKSSGTFNNSVVANLKEDVVISGNTVTNKGTLIDAKQGSAGSSSVSLTYSPTFTSGSHSYRVILSSGSITFYTNAITVTASGGTTKLATPDYTTFSATNITSTSFTAKWGSVSGATKYGILVRSSSGTYEDPVFSKEVSSTSCSVTGLQPGTSYYFQIQARNGNSSQNSTWSKSIANAVTTSSETTKLATPDYTTFSATNISTNSFTAKWGSVSGATKYGILVRSSSGTYEDPVFSKEVSSTSCSVTGLQPGTSYYFQIQARNGNSSQNSTWSKSIANAVTTTSSKLSTPDYTTFSATNITSTSFTAKWGAVSGATKYGILVKKASDSDYSNPVFEKEVSSTSCSVNSGLVAGGSYHFQIQARNGNSSQNSTWSKSIANAVTTSSETTKLATPDYTTFSATNISTNSFTAKWGSVSGATKYGILVRSSSGTYEDPVFSKEVSSTLCSVTGLQPGTSYYFQIQARNGNSSQNSTWSKSIANAVTTSQQTKLATPDYTKFYATDITTTGFTAHWNAVSGAKYYDIKVKKASEANYDNSLTYGTMSTFFKFTDLQPNTAYRFQVHARDDYGQKSDWSPSNPSDIVTKSNSTQTEVADLQIVQSHGFGTTSLTVGEPYMYAVGIYNGSSDPWKGTIYLKDGNENVHYWSLTIDGRSAVVPGFKYIPTAAATNKKLTLYYQTNTNGSGLPIPKGNFTNPLVIQIKQKTSTATKLSLKNAIVCNPSTVELGNTAKLTAKVYNGGTDNWTGTLYFVNNGAQIYSDTYTISAGGDQTITYTWTPSTTGNNTISVYAKANGESSWQLVSPGSYANPVNVNVNRKQTEIAGDYVNLKCLTKDLSPKKVTTGSEVYYHFLVTDMNDNPLRGITAVFSPTGATTPRVTTSVSDDDGIMTLCLKTDGENAVVTKGKTIKLSCDDLYHTNGRHFYINGGNSSSPDYNLSLTVLNQSLFENVENVNFTVDFGLSGKVGFDSYLAGNVSAGVSFPIKYGWTWNEGNELSHYTFGVGINGELGTKLSVGKNLTSKLNLMKGNVNFKGELGYEASCTASSYKSMLYLFIYRVCEALPTSTNYVMRKAADVYKAWYEEKVNDKPTETYGGFWSALVGLNTKFDFGYDTSPGLLKKALRVPQNLGVTGFSVNGDIKWKYSFDKVKKDWNTNTKTYCNSSSIQYGVGGSFNRDTDKDLNLFLVKSFWMNSNIFDFYEQKVLHFFKYKNFDIDKKLTLSVKEDEEYTNEYKNKLSKLSHEVSLTSGLALSVNELKFGNWVPISGSFRYNSTSSSKVTIGGKYLDLIYNKVTSNSSDSKSIKEKETICKAFPAFGAGSVISNPTDIVNVWRYDELQTMSQLSVPAPSSYSLKESMKVEQTNSSTGGLTVNIPIYDFGIAELDLDVGIEVELENRPSESYYSVEHKRFLPVVLRPATSLPSVVEALTNSFTSDVANSYKPHEESLNNMWLKKNNTQWGAGYNNNLIYTNEGLGHSSIQSAKGRVYDWVKKKRPVLAQIQQDDICTFKFVLNDGLNNFTKETDMEFSHFYPAGDLLAVTDNGDTLFVVSEVCDLLAKQDGTNLKTTQNGNFKLDTHIGVDDLTPFGLPENLALDIYYTEQGGNVWHYVGPANNTVMFNKFGSYIMATSIKNDILKPEIVMSYNEDTGILHLDITDNIGVKTNTLKVFVNGESLQMTAINEHSFEAQLSREDMQYKLVVSASIEDLAGNKGECLLLYQLDKPIKPIEVNDFYPDTDISELSNVIYIAPLKAKPGDELTISVNMKNAVPMEGFSFDLSLPEGISFVTDEDGFPEADLSTQRTTKRKTSTFEAAIQPNGNLRVFAASTNGSAFSGNDGEVALVKVKVDENMMSGTYPLILTEISLSDSDAVSYDTEYVKTSIKIQSELTCDVNQDGKVDISDVVAVINTMAGDNKFRATADVNGDGSIDISDVVAIINYMAGDK